MVFSSPRFFVFLAVVLTVLALLPRGTVRKRALAVFSCFFYAAWDWRYLGLLLFISVIDYVAAHFISRGRHRKAWLLLSLVSNLGLLAYFKYCNFFLDNLNLLGMWHFPHQDILLPAGISFYTFKTMSYTIDVYRGDLEPVGNLLDYVTFVSFFPELIAGPIVRASVFLPQLNRPIGPEKSRLAVGLSIFLQGFTKKVFLADGLALGVDQIFANPDYFNSASLWCGVLAYGLQIYFDFSGYSDMAIGTARMIGYDLPENFNMPYLSLSPTEFWRRWHITLSQWLRDYLYIPLGGNRQGRVRTDVNLMLTMLLGGLWHGASWNFVLWGALHGLGLVVHKLWMGWRRPLPKILAWLLTLVFALTLWVPFRADSLAKTWLIWSRMFFPHGQAFGYYPTWLWFSLGVAVLAHWVGARTPDLSRLGMVLYNNGISGPYYVFERLTFVGAYLLCTWVLILVYFAPLNFSPFIYFQF